MKISKGGIHLKRRIYYVSINRDGERLQKSLHTSSKADAQQQYARIVDRLEAGADPFANQGPTFKQIARRYQEFARTTKAPSTFRRDKAIIKILTKRFGDIPLSKIDNQAIEGFLAAEKKAAATKNRELAVLRHLLNKAREWGEIKENPAAGVKPLKVQLKPIRYLTNKEIGKILAKADGIWKQIIVTFLETGLRTGELCRLKWADIDTEKRLITVHGTKSYRVRHLEISDRLLEVLEAIPRENDRLFPFGEDWVIHRVAAICDDKEVGLPDVTCHIFRHTFASRLVTAGVSLRVVQELLGHQSMSMVQVYAHLAPGFLKGTGEKLGYEY